jgi:predicted nucleic acid-binding protein
MIGVLAAAQKADLTITVPAPVISEWFRGNPKRFRAILEAVTVENLTPFLAEKAGKALIGLPPSVSVVDAVVMASAARRGDHVYTSDIPDLQKLQNYFPSVRIFQV